MANAFEEVLLCQGELLLLSLSCLPSSEATGHNSSWGTATPMLSPSGWKRPGSFSKAFPLILGMSTWSKPPPNPKWILQYDLLHQLLPLLLVPLKNCQVSLTAGIFLNFALASACT